jgi:DUF4097 and DUF4098 domain-containing protein YvlB
MHNHFPRNRSSHSDSICGRDFSRDSLLEQIPMRLFLVLMFCLVIPDLQARQAPQTPASSPQAPYVEREQKEFSFYPGGKIEILAGVSGSLTIVGWQKGSIRLEAEKIVYYDTPENAKASLNQCPIRVRWNQTSATIQTAGSPMGSASMEFNLTLYVPRDKTDIKAMVSQGDFSIDSVNGWVEATVGEGSLEARSMSGYFSFNTQRGDIRVEMSGIRWKGLEFAALTQQGSVELQLPEKYSAALQLETRSGKVSVDYPPQVVDGEETPPEITIHKNAQSLKASVGDGGAPIKLVTYSGDVTLSRKSE